MQKKECAHVHEWWWGRHLLFFPEAQLPGRELEMAVQGHASHRCLLPASQPCSAVLSDSQDVVSPH